MICSLAADFASALPGGGRLAGLDPGTKTIGLATCDAGWSFASPHSTLARTKFSADLEKLRGFVKAERIAGMVIGLPLSMDGSDSPRTQSVRALARNLVVLGLPILLWDERWSTAAVERAMIAEDLSRARRADRVDKLAASWILQGALDALTRLPLDAQAGKLDS
ncbi:putative Holliday junction resolvase [Polymorphobacter multimanifer]|uniref:Putative pre-16S rRNA nuclease n=1 Tax=Polymorphobacter multimanifer TaxID=1070431 RepID=A0A841LJQ1_9SPHN|nr:Holliday junction resolvase RuvX [Polymorphobacter multimanifer]MBB6229198.1 putative Holliday junction resolvase [Polymorphobacter multimanifer]